MTLALGRFNPLTRWFSLEVMRPNLKNLNRGLNLSRGLYKLEYGWFHLKLYLICQDLSRGSNSLNSDTGCKNKGIRKFEFVRGEHSIFVIP